MIPAAERFFDRELSWLAFNSRVLELAEDEHLPLLERVRFAAIFASNLDEFFMVRVADLRRRLGPGPHVGRRSELKLIAQRTHELVARHARLFAGRLSGQLAAAGIVLLRYDELATDERKETEAYFAEHVYPVLTPLAVDPVHPFPYVAGLSLNLAVRLEDDETGIEHFARVTVPRLLNRFHEVGPSRFVLLEDVIEAHLPDLFPGLAVVEAHAFRVTRNEDLEIDDVHEGSLVATLERELLRRRFEPPVRLEVDSTISPRALDLLRRELGIEEEELYPVPAPLDLASLQEIAGLDRPELHHRPFVPSSRADLAADVFAVLRERDVLVHHPYDSFSGSVQAFLEQAAADPAVLAIKQTLYRTSGDSPVVDALVEAASSGKQVLVVVEVKARFDERANVRWARALEQAGCQVVYGRVGLKTHAKLSLVVRQEPDGGLRRFVHLGTGNYHPTTARLYEDVGLLTSREPVTTDVAELFNHLSGHTKRRDYATLMVAPDTLRSGIVGLIDREVEHADAGRPSGIVLKVNNLVDEPVVDALYRAARHGVPVDLVVRGMCVLRPRAGISVRSLLGRFLEHSRVFRFHNGGDPEVWIGSADLMHRNLDRRVEACVRVDDPALRQELAEVLDLALDAGIQRWELGCDGSWCRITCDDQHRLDDLQEVLLSRHAVPHR